MLKDNPSWEANLLFPAHEVVKTNDNFITGEHFEQTILKPAQMSCNKVTVQLFNSTTGKLEQEAFTENLVTPMLESRAYNYIANLLSPRVAIPNTPKTAFSPKCIVLSESSLDELEEPYNVPGVVRGMCNINDTEGAGTNPFRGVFNSAESFNKFLANGSMQVHLVYDWQTSSGNGKISHISWCAKPWSYSYSDWGYWAAFDMNCIGDFYRSQNISSIFQDTMRFDPTGSTIIQKNNLWYEVLNGDRYCNGLDTKASLSDAFASTYNPDRIIGDYQYDYTLIESNPGKTSYALKLHVTKRTPRTGGILDEWDEDLLSNIPQLVSLVAQSKLGNTNTTRYAARISQQRITTSDGWTRADITLYASSSSYNIFPSYNSNTDTITENQSWSTEYMTIIYNVLTKTFLRIPSLWDVNTWHDYYNFYGNLIWCRRVEDRDLLSTGNNDYHYAYLCSIDIENAAYTFTKIPFDAYDYVGYYNSGNSSYQPIRYLHKDKPLAIARITDFDALNYPVYMMPIIAQTKLASPINKTSLNTMKIQYDFIFKIPLPYVDPTHVWDLNT